MGWNTSTESMSLPSIGRIAWLAVRPRTLSISIAPLLLGGAFAHEVGHVFVGGAWWPALLAAILIQIGTNLMNDAVDALKGNDLPDRPGPIRVTAAGWVSPARVKQAACACFLGALLIGVWLVYLGGWPILLLGLVSLVAGWAYSAGPYPISYSPWGEVVVLLLFGILAVWGVAWLQGGAPGLVLGLAGVICGAPAAAVLMVNNTRDRVADQRVGRRTLAIVLGRKKATLAYQGLLALSVTALVVLLVQGVYGCLPGFLVCPKLWRLGQDFANADDAKLNALLPETAKVGFLLSLLVSLGVWAIRFF